MFPKMVFKICQNQPQPQHLAFIADNNGHLLPCYKAQMRNPPKPNWGPRVLSIWDVEELEFQKRIERRRKYTTRAQCFKMAIYQPVRKVSSETFFRRYMVKGTPKPQGPESSGEEEEEEEGEKGLEGKPEEEEEFKPPQEEPVQVPMQEEVKPEESDEINEQALDKQVNRTFQKLKQLRLPIVWICGYPNKCTATARSDMIREIKNRNGFTYIDPDAEIRKLLVLGEKLTANPNLDLVEEFRLSHPVEVPPNTPSLEQPSSTHQLQSTSTQAEEGNATMLYKRDEDKLGLDFRESSTDHEMDEKFKLPRRRRHKELKPRPPKPTLEQLGMTPEILDKCVRYLIRIAKSATNPENEIPLKLLTKIQLFKLLMILAYPTSGYIIDYYPTSRTEVAVFEVTIWECVVALYFACFPAKNVRVNEGYVVPPYDRRHEPYDDIEMEDELAEIGERLLKVYFNREWRDEQLQYFNCLVDTYFGRKNCEELIKAISGVKIKTDTGTNTEEDQTNSNS